MKKSEDVWVLYVLRCGDGSLYCGITNNPERRLEQHKAGSGARYTRGRSPLELARQWACGDRSTALKTEAAFKRLSRAGKLRQLASPEGSPLFQNNTGKIPPTPVVQRATKSCGTKQSSTQLDPNRTGRRSPGKIR